MSGFSDPRSAGLGPFTHYQFRASVETKTWETSRGERETNLGLFTGLLRGSLLEQGSPHGIGSSDLHGPCRYLRRATLRYICAHGHTTCVRTLKQVDVTNAGAICMRKQGRIRRPPLPPPLPHPAVTTLLFCHWSAGRACHPFAEIFRFVPSLFLCFGRGDRRRDDEPRHSAAGVMGLPGKEGGGGVENCLLPCRRLYAGRAQAAVSANSGIIPGKIETTHRPEPHRR